MKSRQRNREAFREHSYWQSYSDMMAALLLIFILMIAITLAIYRQKTNDLEQTRLELNTAQSELDATIEDLELSKTEQRLLRMLVENKGITLAREQLLDFTWSVDAAFVDENTLSVAMKRLRDKLDAQERIKTVYGIGYRWE